MALFAAGIVAISRLFTGSLRLSGGARDASAAAIYARQRMEEALLAPDPAEGVEQGAFGEGYRWKLETSFVPPAEEKPYDEITYRVTVTWDDGGEERVDGAHGRAVAMEEDPMPAPDAAAGVHAPRARHRPRDPRDDRGERGGGDPPRRRVDRAGGGRRPGMPRGFAPPWASSSARSCRRTRCRSPWATIRPRTSRGRRRASGS